MTYTENNRFTIRVYAIIINGKNEVLLSDEYEFNTLMTKFPGGGLDFGEGTIEALEREAIEELGQEIEVLEHFYTTDFFQAAFFKENIQLISIYYKAKLKGPIQFKISDKAFDFERIDLSQSFRWAAIDQLNVDEITFPIDKKVAGMIKQEYVGQI